MLVHMYQLFCKLHITLIKFLLLLRNNYNERVFILKGYKLLDLDWVINFLTSIDKVWWH